MLVAAPESSCGVVACGGAGVMLGSPVCVRCLAVPAVADRSVRPTRASVALADAGEGARATFSSRATSSSLLLKRVCWASFGGGTYSVAGVSSRELAKWEPMPLAYSAAETIHWLRALQMLRR